MKYRNSWYLTHPWLVVAEIATGIKYFIQRGRRGYSEEDVWDLDHYLSSWLPKAIRELRDCGSTYPNKHGMTKKQWHTMLTKMAEGFEEVNVDGLGKKFINKWMKENLKKQKGRDLFSFWFWSLWD